MDNNSHSNIQETDTDMRTIAVNLLENLIRGNKQYIEQYAAEDYIQHNPVVADRREGLLAFMDGVSKVEPKVEITPVRAYVEGDLVIVHSEYNLSGPKVLFDLFRFENGQIVEHWDSIQEVPSTTVSGHGMSDGQTEVTDLDKTQVNKSLVLNFVNDLLVNGKIDQIDTYIAPEYIQHNPNIADTRDGLKKFISSLAEELIVFKYTKIHKVVAEGNFVYTFSEGLYDGKETVFSDLFRVENGMIIEHWDIVQDLPTEFAHHNGMF